MKHSRNFYADRVAALGLRSTDIALLADVNVGRVADFLTQRRLSAAVEQRIADAITQLYEIQIVVHPAKFDLSTPDRIAAAQALVDVYREKKQAEADQIKETA